LPALKRQPSSGQFRKEIEISGYQRFLLCSRPAFDLPFSSDRIRDPLEGLRKYKRHRKTLSGVTIEVSNVMLADANFERATRGASVITAIDATKNVKPDVHFFVSLHHHARSPVGLRASSAEGLELDGGSGKPP
jgi:hypothetical protein